MNYLEHKHLNIRTYLAGTWSAEKLAAQKHVIRTGRLGEANTDIRIH